MAASTVPSVELGRVADHPLNYTERAAIAGFLAGYAGNRLVSYTTDLRLFVEWFTNNNLRLMEARRAHLEIFGRAMEADGRMRSTVARRLSTLGSLSCVDLAVCVERTADQRSARCQHRIDRPGPRPPHAGDRA